MCQQNSSQRQQNSSQRSRLVALALLEHTYKHRSPASSTPQEAVGSRVAFSLCAPSYLLMATAATPRRLLQTALHARNNRKPLKYTDEISAHLAVQRCVVAAWAEEEKHRRAWRRDETGRREATWGGSSIASCRVRGGHRAAVCGRTGVVSWVRRGGPEGTRTK